MKINLITNWVDQKGLWRDGCIMERLLDGWGHQPVRVQYTDRQRPHPADLNIFLETLQPDLFPLAPVNWWVPNPEWADSADLAALQHVDRVVCKTREAERLFALLTDRTVYVGFESEDHYDPSVPRETRALHIAGGSILKGTQTVLDAWERYVLPFPLTVVGDEQTVKPRQIPNVTYRLSRLSDEELRTLQNSHIIHLCPSETEGWGHTIWEGMSCNAMVLTTQEIDGTWRIPAVVSSRRCLALLMRVDSESIAAAVRDRMAAREGDPSFRPAIWEPCWPTCFPRTHFLAARDAFRERLKVLVDHAASMI